ncbi:MAG: hypothetical protein OXE87_03400, partial [Chloroflexi bacterium]|nr:hypothetical protein [Chloroflexota bacterium]
MGKQAESGAGVGAPRVLAQSATLSKPTNVQATLDAAEEITLTLPGEDSPADFLLMDSILDPISSESVLVSDGIARTGKATGLTGGQSYVGAVAALEIDAGGDFEHMYDWDRTVSVESETLADESPVDRAASVALYNATDGAAKVVAHSEVPSAANITVRAGSQPGEMIISWDAVPQATYYRIGYVNMEIDYHFAKASCTG